MATLQAVHPVLMASDVLQSIAFYRDLGFRLLFQDAPDAPRYAGIGRDAVQLHLQWADPSQFARAGDRPVYRFLVDDVDALHAAFVVSGRLDAAASHGPWALPAPTPWGTCEFHVRDPGLNILQFYQPLA